MNDILASLREAAKILRSGKADKTLKFTAKQIKQIRASLHMTQVQFADHLVLSVQTIRSWEQDVRKPGTISLIMLGALIQEQKKKST